MNDVDAFFAFLICLLFWLVYSQHPLYDRERDTKTSAMANRSMCDSRKFRNEYWTWMCENKAGNFEQIECIEHICFHCFSNTHIHTHIFHHVKFLYQIWKKNLDQTRGPTSMLHISKRMALHLSRLRWFHHDLRRNISSIAGLGRF